MTKIIITGANSFVGRNYIKNSKYQAIEEICLVQNPIEKINFSSTDVVLHVAAIVHQSKEIPESEYFRVNRDLCLEVAKRAKEYKVGHFIFISTVKVYGEYSPSKGTWNEQAVCEPDDPYGKSKYAAEQGLKELEDKNFIVSIIRPPLIYGVGVKANMLSIIKLVDKFPALPLGRVQNKRSFTAVENLVALIDKIIETKSSGIFIAMDDKPLSTTELVQLIAKALNKRIYLFQLPKVIINIGKKAFPGIFDRLYGSFEIDNFLTREKLDFKPVISSEEGIKRMVVDYKHGKEQ